MPGIPSQWLDTGPPAQYVFGQGGAAGPQRSIFADTGSTQMNTTNYDTTLHWKLAGTIIGALLVVFVLQQLGFRFVVAVGG